MMQNSQATAENHLLKRKMGKDVGQAEAESRACQVYKTMTMQVHWISQCLWSHDICAHCDGLMLLILVNDTVCCDAAIGGGGC